MPVQTKLDLKFTDQVSAFEFGNGTVNVVKKMQGDPAMDFTANSGEKNPKCVQKVQVMDACQFLRQTIGVIQADFVVIKLDVESVTKLSTFCTAAVYPVLQHCVSVSQARAVDHTALTLCVIR